MKIDLDALSPEGRALIARIQTGRNWFLVGALGSSAAVALLVCRVPGPWLALALGWFLASVTVGGWHVVTALLRAKAIRDGRR